NDAYTVLNVQRKPDGQAYDWLNNVTSTSAQGEDNTGQGAGQAAGVGYEACRVPWRVAQDYVWFGEAAASAYMNSLMPGPFPDDQNNSCFVGGVALARINQEQATFDAAVSKWLGDTRSGGDAPYYANTLRLLYMVLAAGLSDKTL